MRLTDLAEWAATKFGSPTHTDDAAPRVPAGPPARSREPDWLPSPAALADDTRQPGDLSTEAPGEAVLPLDPDDRPVIEADDPSLPLSDVPQEPPGDLLQGGTDVLAYYRPFRFYRKGWGIHVLASGMAYLARQLKGATLTGEDSPLLQVGYDVLYEHEYGHFLCEGVATLGEVGHLRPWYMPYFGNRTAASTEEGMANALALRRVKGRALSQVRTRLKAWMTSQGEGYRDFAQFVSPGGARRGREALARAMAPPSAGDANIYRVLADICREEEFGGQLEEKARGFEQAAESVEILRGDPGKEWPSEVLWASVNAWRARPEIPTYLVIDRPLPWLKVARPFPRSGGVRVEVYTRDHDPPHIHVFMPPDRERGKYRWPDLEPAARDVAPLTSRERSGLAEYLSRYGPAVHERLERVYSRSLPDWVPA